LYIAFLLNLKNCIYLFENRRTRLLDIRY